MKKLTLSIGLVGAMLTAKSQDTTDIMITEDKVYYFERGTVSCYKKYLHNNNILFYAADNEIIEFHLYDDKLRTRKFTTTYSDGKVTVNILDSKNNIYLSPLGPVKIKIGKSKLIQKL